jgi:hypothetical protein
MNLRNTIATELYDGQGLGNQLWAYVSARSVAEELDANFVLCGYDRFKGADFLDIDFLDQQHKDHKIVNYDVLNEVRYYDSSFDCLISSFDRRVIDIQTPTKLEGLFQSERYLFGDIEKLNRFLKLKPSFKERVSIPEDTCILNIRGGEYKRHKNLILPMSYWDNAIKNMQNLFGVKKFLVVTDDIRYSKLLFPKYEVLNGGISHCYVALNNAKYVIVSNSSFSYFPLKTNQNSPVVIAPKYWSRFGNKFNRWASPANLYSEWLWQDVLGKLNTYDDCLEENINNELYYRNNFFIFVKQDFALKSRIRHYFPAAIRFKIKKMLSFFFPRKYG